MAGAATPGKDRFSSLDTLAVARELRALVGGRVDKAFDRPPDGLTLTFRSAAAGRRELLLVPGRYAALVTRAGGHDEQLSPFARELRRLLSGAQLLAVADPGGERYLELTFRRPDVDGPLVLGVELFGAGNVLVARGERLVAVLHPRRWAHRTLRVGAEYRPPPARADPWRLGVAELEAALAGSRTDRVSTLAARLAFGGPVAEELLVRAGLAGGAPAPDDAGPAAAALHRAIAELRAELAAAPAGYLYGPPDGHHDVEPVACRRWREDPASPETVLPTFSEAVVAYFTDRPAPSSAPAPPADPARAELERQLGRQRSAVVELEAGRRELTEEAERILVHYAEAEARLAEASTSAENGTVEAQVGGGRVRLRVGEPVRASATALYDEAKRIASKLDGARAAVAETERRLAATGPASPAVRAAAAPRARRAHWFERHRWFLSSEGILVLGGRDAPSNDLLVRRHLNPGDVYLHADIHGAPSVVVKHPPPGRPEPTDTTFREAGQWGLAFSKAWRAGLASGTAFWVTPDQVSKSGASGEFVPRGAWVIHGTKNVLKDLDVELGIGFVDYEGERLASVAPPSALRARGELRFLLTPGPERERASREVELARELGMPRDRLQALLPAGGLTVRRV